MKIVLDTNCLVNVIMPGSYNNDIWQAFRAGKYMLCVSNEILFEIKRRSSLMPLLHGLYSLVLVDA